MVIHDSKKDLIIDKVFSVVSDSVLDNIYSFYYVIAYNYIDNASIEILKNRKNIGLIRVKTNLNISGMKEDLLTQLKAFEKRIKE